MAGGRVEVTRCLRWCQCSMPLVKVADQGRQKKKPARCVMRPSEPRLTHPAKKKPARHVQAATAHADAMIVRESADSRPADRQWH